MHCRIKLSTHPPLCFKQGTRYELPNSDRTHSSTGSVHLRINIIRYTSKQQSNKSCTTAVESSRHKLSWTAVCCGISPSQTGSTPQCTFPVESWNYNPPTWLQHQDTRIAVVHHTRVQAHHNCSRPSQIDTIRLRTTASFQDLTGTSALRPSSHSNSSFNSCCGSLEVSGGSYCVEASFIMPRRTECRAASPRGSRWW